MGYNVGGPIVLPKEKLKDRLFFFWGQEWHRQLIPTTPRQVRMPTALELAGDFSQTRDGNGVAITVTDPLTKAPFPGNKIPAKANVDYVGEYQPTWFGFGKDRKGIKPGDLELKR